MTTSNHDEASLNLFAVVEYALAQGVNRTRMAGFSPGAPEVTCIEDGRVACKALKELIL